VSAWTHFPSLASIAGGALIASPNRGFREQVLGRLNGRCRPVQQALGGADALAKLAEGHWPFLFLDRRMPDLESDELVMIIAQRFPGIQVVLLDSAGADCAQSEQSEEREERAEREEREERAPGSEPSPLAGPQRIVQEDCNAKKSAGMVGAASLPGMIGQSPAMLHVYRLARLVAPRTTTVLIAGATGSGKELVARALHTLSPRSSKAFVAVNCAAIPEALLESELFGHARGAFTGAVQAQVGRIPAAHGGTLFLDEVSELPLGMQAKLLRFLEQKEVQRLGTAELSRVDVRVVAASNVDLAARTGRGEFREDLFYRLSAFPLELPPLTERREDIVPLAEHFLACMAAAVGGIHPVLSDAAIAILEGHAWRGNVRELQHVMERASILVENGPTILSEHLYFPFQQTRAPGGRNLSCSSLAS
jgi:DNA-binding NtrC family response regulator